MGMKVLRVGVVCLLGWWAVVYVMQDKMMYPIEYVPKRSVSVLPQYGVKLEREIDEGKGRETVEAWLMIPPVATKEKPGPLVVYGHGNGETIDMQTWMVDGYMEMGCVVLLVEYRGYGRSGGRPGQEKLREDLVYFVDLVMGRPEVDKRRVIYHGRSLGGAVMADLSREREPGALILESTMVSTGAFAWKYLAPAFLARNPYRTDEVVSKLNKPMLVMHGKRDDLMPVWHGKKLHELGKGSEYVEFDAGHNDLGWENREMFWKTIGDFLRKNGMVR